jgi:hypothetical protein
MKSVPGSSRPEPLLSEPEPSGTDQQFRQSDLTFALQTLTLEASSKRCQLVEPIRIDPLKITTEHKNPYTL